MASPAPVQTPESKMEVFLQWVDDEHGSNYAHAFRENEMEWNDMLDEAAIREILEDAELAGADEIVAKISRIETGEDQRVEPGKAAMFHDWLSATFAKKSYSDMLVDQSLTTWEDLEYVDEPTLKECGIKLVGHRKRINRKLDELRRQGSVDNTPQQRVEEQEHDSRPTTNATTSSAPPGRVSVGKVKVVMGSETIRVKLLSGDPLREIRGQVGLSEGVQLYYEDEDGDRISIRTNEDVWDAISQKARIHVASAAPSQNERNAEVKARSELAQEESKAPPRASMGKVKVMMGTEAIKVKLVSDNPLREILDQLGLSENSQLYYEDEDVDRVLIRTNEDVRDAVSQKARIHVASPQRENASRAAEEKELSPIVATQPGGASSEEGVTPGEPSVARQIWPQGVHVVDHKIVVSDQKQAMEENPTLKRSQFIDLKGPNAIMIDDTNLLAILVVGQTGAGKTTLINSIVNVLYCVEFEDEFRLKLIVEPPTAHRQTQAQSQTNQVFGYFLERPPLLRGKSLLIVDTPGFGDSRGFAQDERIMASIKEFFENKIDFLNAVCFVCKAPDARVGPLNKYIFDKVLGLFGKEIADIIMLLFTFADGKKPPALTAIESENVEYAKWFPLNNSAFFLEDKESESNMFAKMFWDMGQKSIETFLATVVNSPPKGLESCRAVLQKREKLQCSIVSMRKLVSVGLSKLDELEQTVRVMQQHSAEMSATADFEFEVTLSKRERKEKPSGSYNTVCDTCTWTCHESCAYDDSRKMDCSAMDSNGYCENCPRKCHWGDHHNRNYYFAEVPYKEKRTKDDLKQRYCNAQSGLSDHEQIMRGLQSEFDTVQVDVLEIVHQIKDAVNALDRLALRPGLMHDDQYFDLMIEQERQERKWGWQRRVDELEKIKERSQYLSEVAASDDYNPLEQRRQEIAAQARQVNRRNSRQSSGGVASTVRGMISRGLAWWS